MSYIKNTDSLVEGSSQLFFSEERALAAVQEDLDALSAAIAAEETRAEAAEASLDGRLDVVEGSGEGSILKAKQDAQSYADQKVAALVNSAPAVLDTLKELSDALGGDENFAATVANQIGAVDAKVDQEVSDRQSAVSAEQGRAQAAEQALDGRLDVIEGSGEGSVAKAEQDAKDFASGLVSDEESARMAADLSLGNRVSALEVDPVSKSYVDSAMGSEQSAREAADSALDARLDILEQDETTKAYVDQQVSAEQSARQSADALLDGRLDALELDPVNKAYVDGEVSDLQGQITAEVSARQSAVSSETSARQSADQALDGRLDVLESDPVTKAYVDGEVSDLQGQVTQEISDRQTAVSGEASARQSADTALGGRLSVLENDPTTKAYVDGEISSVEAALAQEVSDRQSAVSFEADARSNADIALGERLDELELDPVSKAYVDGEVSGLQGQVNTEKGRIDAILSASQADKDSFAEIVSLINSVDTANDSAFAGYVLSNDAALAAEVSARQSAVSAEQSARESADNALDGRLDVLEADSTTQSYVDGQVDTLEAEDLTFLKLDGSRSMTGQLNLELNANPQMAFKATVMPANNGVIGAINFQPYNGTGYSSSVKFSALATEGHTASARGSKLNIEATASGSTSRTVVASFAGNRVDMFQDLYVNSVLIPNKTYVDSADDARLKLDGTNSMTGVLNFTGASGKNITWGTDGGGNIGADGVNRPNNVYIKSLLKMAGPIQGNQSNVSTPGYGFSGATNFGMFYDTNTVGLAASGQAALTCTVAQVSAAKPLAMMQGYSVHRTAVTTNASITPTQGLIAVTDTSAARTLTLPSAAGVTWRHYIIKDESGGASATRYIRVQPPAGQTLDGAAYYDIKVPYEALIVYSNGTNWFII